MKPSNLIRRFVEWDGCVFRLLKVAPVRYKSELQDTCSLRAHLIVKALFSIAMVFVIAMIVASVINFIGYSIYGLVMFKLNPLETLGILEILAKGSVLGQLANFIAVILTLTIVCLSIFVVIVTFIFGLVTILKPLFIRTNFSELYQSYKQKYCKKVEWK